MNRISRSESVGGTGVAGSIPASLPRYPSYPQPRWLFFLAFLAFVVARYISINERMGILEAIRAEFLIGVTVLVMCAMMLADRRPTIGKASGLLAFIGLLFVAMVVQLPFAADPETAKRVFNDRVVKFAMLTFMICVMVESPLSLKLFIATFLFSIFYITLESVEGLIGGGLYWQNQGVMRLHGAVAQYGHPNSLGGVSMGVLPFTILLFPHVRKWFLRLGLIASGSTAMVCVVYSGSRTAYMGLMGLVFWLWLQSEKKGKFLVKLLIVGVIAVSLLPDQYIERFESIGGKEKEGHSKETRKVILEDAIRIFLDNPLGVGVASFPAVRTQRFGRSQDTHNLYLEVGTNLGVQGLVVFLGLVWIMMSTLHRVEKEFGRQRERLRRVVASKRFPRQAVKACRAHDRDLAFLIAVSQSIGGFIFIRLVLGMFGMDLYEIYWWFGAGVTFVLSGLVERTWNRTHFYDVLVAGDDAGFADQGPGPGPAETRGRNR